MRDYPNILVAFLDDYEAGFAFERWPHHITVLPWFKADRTALADIGQLCGQNVPLAATITELSNFGLHGDTAVRLVGSPDLVKLHRQLLSPERRGLLGLSATAYTHDSYRPHLTLQGQNDPAPGPIEIRSIALVCKLGAAKTKTVIDKFV